MWEVGDIIYRALPSLVEAFRIVEIIDGNNNLFSLIWRYGVKFEHCLNGKCEWEYFSELKNQQQGLVFYSTDIKEAFDWVKKFEDIPYLLTKK